MAKEIKTIGVLTSGGDAPGMNHWGSRKPSQKTADKCSNDHNRYSGFPFSDAVKQL